VEKGTPVKKLLLVVLVSVVLPSVLCAWGITGHKIINRNAVIHLPASMQQIIAQQAFFEAHASDADNRKNSDPTEGDKHFIDIDSYPNFQNKVMSEDSLKAIYGVSNVTTIGTLPWVTVTTLDSLTAQFRRADWAKAYLTASDLGHYIGDGHQPLHLTKNYDGQLSGNSGIHSRYETTMLGAYQTSIVVVKDSVRYVGDPLGYVFRYVDAVTSYTDSIMAADTQSKAIAGSTSGTLYLSSMWARAGTYTASFIQSATLDLASFWYTAWVNAGLLLKTTDVAAGAAAVPDRFVLSRNYPNPFNPTTTVKFTIGSAQHVTIDVYDVLGRSVASLVNDELHAGSYAIQWNASAQPSGVYYCRMQAGAFAAVQQMILAK
jgi:hypothetical protein